MLQTRNYKVTRVHRHGQKQNYVPRAQSVAREIPPNAVQQDTNIICLADIIPFTIPGTLALGIAAYTGALPLPTTGPLDPAALRPLLAAAPAALFFLVYPALDLLLGPRQPERQAAAAPDTLLSRAAPALAVALHAILSTCAYAAIAGACSPAPFLASALAAGPPTPAPLALTALLLSGVLVSGMVALAACHELLHSRNGAHRAAAQAGLAWMWIHPYYRAHPHHHLHVGTPDDPTSAPRGRNAWAYVPAYIAHSYAEAYIIAEAERKRRGSAVNGALAGIAAQVAITAALAACLGPAAAATHVAVAALATTFLALFDYALHYGLDRPALHPGVPQDVHGSAAGAAEPDAAEGGGGGLGVADAEAGPPPPRYAAVSRDLSWCSHYPVENALLFNVLLHADHHLAAAKSYRRLRPLAGAPTFPAPLQLLAWATLAPPLWRAAMDRRADEVNARVLQSEGLA